MNRRRIRPLAFAAAAFVLVSCRIDVPEIQAGRGELYENGRPVKTWQLNQQQLRALSQWLSSHQSGWTPSVVDFVPVLQITLQHKDGASSGMNIRTQNVIVYGTPGQFVQGFSTQELSGLRALVTETP
jgi:hypothetical protein